MDGVSNVERLGHAEISAELGAIFETISQATANDAPKFAPAVCRRLTRDIVCRTYAGAIHELCHLARIGDAAFGRAGYEALFWGGGPARADDFRRRVTAAGRRGGCGGLIVSAAEARMVYGDGEFAVSWSRMPLLSALMEFLVSALGYETFDGALRYAPDTPPDRASISRAANGIARELYAFLKAHLPSAHAQRKFHFMMNFLRRRHDGRGIGPEHFDDATVLDFWLFAAPGTEGEADFRKFETVFRAFVDLRSALAAGRDRALLQAALPLGSDRAAGEVDPADVDAAIAHVESRRAPLDVLRTAPANAIKFLNKREVAAIALLMEAGDGALAMPLSVLRVLVFGAVQARITQSLRRGDAGPPPAMASNQAEGYSGRTQRIRDTGGHLERVLLATFHVLASARHGRAITVLLGLRPEIDLTPLAPLVRGTRGTADNVVDFPSPAAGVRFLSDIAADPENCPDLAAFASEAKAAFGRIARHGFHGADNGGAIIDGFADAVEALFAIRDQVERFLGRLSRTRLAHGCWDRQHAADRAVFDDRFRALYGEST